jgi:hypothetical protein
MIHVASEKKEHDQKSNGISGHFPSFSDMKVFLTHLVVLSNGIQASIKAGIKR